MQSRNTLDAGQLKQEQHQEESDSQLTVLALAGRDHRRSQCGLFQNQKYFRQQR